MGHLHKNTLYMEGKEGGGCLLDEDVFLELKSVCNKISDFNIRNLILLICTGSYSQPVWQEASVMLILHISFSLPCMFSIATTHAFKLWYFLIRQ